MGEKRPNPTVHRVSGFLGVRKGAVAPRVPRLVHVGTIAQGLGMSFNGDEVLLLQTVLVYLDWRNGTHGTVHRS